MLLDKRVVVVTGKGGVGKTTVCAALGLEAARRGRRVLICETQGAERLPALFGKKSMGYQPTGLAPNLTSISITSEASLEDYLLKILHFKKIYQLVFRNRVMGPFVDAVPGLHDLIQLGKVMDLERTPGVPYDFFIVDAPATGHGLTMLKSPRVMMELTARGPFYENAGLIAGMVEDPRKTAIVLVSTPEDLPVQEALELYDQLAWLQRQVVAVVLNEVQGKPVRNTAFFTEQLEYLLEYSAGASRAAVLLAKTGLDVWKREEQARLELARIPAKPASMPLLSSRELGASQLSQLGQALGGLL
jgi:anion-transporting  ArsA/GET3 family ATPase